MILCEGPIDLLAESQSQAVPLRVPVITASSTHCHSNGTKFWDPSKDLHTIAITFYYLEASGWYWGTVTASEANSLLQMAPEGTFLIRNSSHPLYLLTLSVKTDRGPTNVRIEYSRGRFQLDSCLADKGNLLSFPNVPSLVQHYVTSAKGKDEVLNKEEEESQPVLPAAPKESAVLLKLKHPLRQPLAFPSLQHLTRLAINRCTTCPAALPLPKPLLKYLKDYPFQL